MPLYPKALTDMYKMYIFLYVHVYILYIIELYIYVFPYEKSLKRIILEEQNIVTKEKYISNCFLSKKIVLAADIFEKNIL